MKRLDEMQRGESGRVAGFDGGRGMQQQLLDMGLRVGAEVTIMSPGAGGGPVFVQTGETRIAIGHGMAKRVTVDTRASGDEVSGLTLADAKEGDRLRVLRLHGRGPIRQRLLDMGFTRGTDLLVERYAPLRDPIAIRIKDFSLALRVAEGRMIEVELIDADAQ